jgi:hypothetical protein
MKPNLQRLPEPPTHFDGSSAAQTHLPASMAGQVRKSTAAATARAGTEGALTEKGVGHPTPHHRPHPSPPRPAGRGAEGWELGEGLPPATRTLAEELPRLPDPTTTRASLFLSSPPQPARGRRHSSSSARARKEPAASLLKGGAVSSTAPCSDHQSQRRRRKNPRIPIWLLRSGHPHPGKEALPTIRRRPISYEDAGAFPPPSSSGN